MKKKIYVEIIKRQWERGGGGGSICELKAADMIFNQINLYIANRTI